MVPNAITPPPHEAYILWICDPSDVGNEVAVPPTSLRRERRAGITDVPVCHRDRILLRAAAGYVARNGSGVLLTGVIHELATIERGRHGDGRQSKRQCIIAGRDSTIGRRSVLATERQLPHRQGVAVRGDTHSSRMALDRCTEGPAGTAPWSCTPLRSRGIGTVILQALILCVLTLGRYVAL